MNHLLLAVRNVLYMSFIVFFVLIILGQLLKILPTMYVQQFREIIAITFWRLLLFSNITIGNT